MVAKIYVLQVAINDYTSPVSKLSGCVNDIDHMHDFLTDTYDAGQLHIETLKNSEATRANIIHAFRTHLSRAQRDDVVFFQYSGHGARSVSAEPFRLFFPSGLEEGLVCYDSRTGRGDLADKELAVLLAELARNEPHIAVMLDCCHSGSATRQVDDISQSRVRQIFEEGQARPLELYIDGYYEKRVKQGLPIEIPSGRHVLLSACDRTQKAWEGRDNRGVFTKTLLDVLSQTGPSISYADLFMRCRRAVRKSADNQNPQFETHRGFSAYAGFLGGKVSKQSRRFTVAFDGGWRANCGALHGLPTDADQRVQFALYDAKDAERLLGHAVATQIGAQTSALALEDLQPRETDVFQAELTSMPIPPLIVQLVGDQALIQILQARLESAADQSYGFALVTDAAESARYTLTAKDDSLMLRFRETQRLVQGAVDTSDVSQAHIFDVLKKIANWERSQGLHNPSTKLSTADIEFGLWETVDGEPTRLLTEDEFTFTVTKKGDEDTKLQGTFKARNGCKQPLHFALIHYSDNYGIRAFYNEPQPAGSSEFVITMDGDRFFTLEIEPDRDIEEHQFKLIVSTEEIDDFMLVQDGITLGYIHDRKRTLTAKGLKTGPDPKTLYRNEWFTKDIRVRLVRQRSELRSQDVKLADGKITVKGNALVQANVNFNSARSAARSIAQADNFYLALERAGMELVSFSSTRGDDQSILELSNIRNAEQLAEHPLEIEVDLGLKADEHILPLTYDGEHIALAGQSFTDASGVTKVQISELPPQPQNARSLGRALKLYFFKTYLGIKNLNQLCWIEYQPDGSFNRHADGVFDRVKQAKSIVLLIHGIIGNTDSIVQGLQRACDAEGRNAASRFDLVLTYDYENLSTPIGETAKMLKKQLQIAGFAADDGKRLTLMVHSMGGLVSRWFIEKEEGSQLVDHLVMFGTPNVGSPFGEVDSARKLSTILTTIALNMFPAFAPFGGVLLSVLNRSRKVTPCLEQMKPTSEFIDTLNKSPDPGVRYTIFAGNIHSYDAAQDTQLGKLIAKLGSGVVFDLIYPHMGHDIAVAGSSIRGVPDTRTPAPLKNDLACHHLNYFSTEAGYKAMLQVVGGESSEDQDSSEASHAATGLPDSKQRACEEIDRMASDAPEQDDSPRERLLRFVVDFLRKDAFSSYLVIFAFTWTWLTLIDLTVALTRQIDINSPAAVASILVAIPTFFAWLSMLAITQTVFTLLEAAVLQIVTPKAKSQNRQGVERFAVPASRLIKETQHWAKYFIIAWILNIFAKSVAGIIMSTYFFMRG